MLDFFQQCQRKAWKDGHFKVCKKRNTAKKTALTGQKHVSRDQEIQNHDSELSRPKPIVSRDEKKDENDSDEYEIITTKITKMTLDEDFSFPVIDNSGNHLFSVSQKQINENKDLA